MAKSHTADAGRYSYRYADLAAVLDVVRPVLACHELAVTQHVSTADNGRVTTSVLHSSGQWIAFEPFTMRRRPGSSVGRICAHVRPPVRPARRVQPRDRGRR
ncbi:MAG: hypothetical protein R2697_19175 [Ilumatobacteraceae bacterium]